MVEQLGNEIEVIIGNKVQKHMDILNLSANDLASYCEVTEECIEDILNGSTKTIENERLIKKMSEILDIEESDLIEYKTKKGEMIGKEISELFTDLNTLEIGS